MLIYYAANIFVVSKNLQKRKNADDVSVFGEKSTIKIIHAQTDESTSGQCLNSGTSQKQPGVSKSSMTTASADIEVV